MRNKDIKDFEIYDLGLVKLGFWYLVLRKFRFREWLILGFRI